MFLFFFFFLLLELYLYQVWRFRVFTKVKKKNKEKKHIRSSCPFFILHFWHICAYLLRFFFFCVCAFVWTSRRSCLIFSSFFSSYYYYKHRRNYSRHLYIPRAYRFPHIALLKYLGFFFLPFSEKSKKTQSKETRISHSVWQLNRKIRLIGCNRKIDRPLKKRNISSCFVTASLFFFLGRPSFSFLLFSLRFPFFFCESWRCLTNC